MYKINHRYENVVDLALRTDNHTEILTFGFYESVGLPSINLTHDLTKRQFYVNVFCIYDEIRRTGYMYVWPESIASRGSQEIGSCLYRHLHENLPKETSKLILYSDPCSGQNRNIKLSLILKKFLDSWQYSNLTSIEQRFFVNGHGFNICDQIFEVIRKQIKESEFLFLPSHLIDILKKVKKADLKFIIKEMGQNDFLSLAPLVDLLVNSKLSLYRKKLNGISLKELFINE